jgi:transglutaminase-like putative cysteine protease
MSGERLRYRIVHRTEYEYGLPVELAHNEAHLRPRSGTSQRCLMSEVAIAPVPIVVRDRVDYFGNATTYFALALPDRRLAVTATSEVEVVPPRGDAALPISSPFEEVRDRLSAAAAPNLLEPREFVLASPMVEASAALRDYAAPSFPRGRPLFEAASDLVRRIHRDFAYEPASTTIGTSLADVLEQRRGVCQDFAHLAIGCLRSLGLAARYVSGYVESAPPGRTRARGADASHAWLATYDPMSGWLDLDPTNDQVPARQHVTLAWGRDYGDVAPLKGVLVGGGEHAFAVSVDVQRVESRSLGG